MIETGTKSAEISEISKEKIRKPFLHKTFDSYKETDISKMFKREDRPKKQTKENVEERASKEFENLTKMQEETLKTSLEIVLPKNFDDSKSMFMWNYKTKLLCFLFCFVFLSFTFLTIYFAVTIHNAKKSNQKLNSQIATESELLNWIDKEYSYLSDENVLLNRAKSQGFDEISSENTITFSLNKKEETIEQKQKTNWFDRFCDFVFKLFGG